MYQKKLNSGNYCGVSINSFNKLILLQTQDDYSQNRIRLTTSEARLLSKKLLVLADLIDSELDAEEIDYFYKGL